ncbi:diacylglycerol kinase [Alcaligenes phenolicus]|uniref:Diacylglycerol kinase n=1 Tax=Alcaligenes phenolicus TaxID=232846 RepID=A0AAW5VWH4_9BURK|nr:diacylglycerol kinase [Alcaligenes phenolicus]MCX5566046.1 diacylglycerol kinase [Alcaligenes phenolicus]
MRTPNRNSPFKSNGGVARIGNALSYSMSGLKAAFLNEAAFRQELLLFAILLPLSFVVGQTFYQRLLLILVMCLVLVVELINSAIEAVADSISLEWNAGLGLAKDLGSAAVMLSILCAAGVWLALIYERIL